MLAVLAACAPEKMVVVQIADAQLGFMGGERAKTEGAEWADDLSYEVKGTFRMAVDRKIRHQNSLYTV